MAESREQKPQTQQNQNDPNARGGLTRRGPERALGTAWENPQGSEWASPFTFMRRLMSDMDSLFAEFGFGSPGPGSQLRSGEANVWMPQMDVTTRNGELLVHADLPGLKQEDVKVTVHEGVLSIEGERHDQHEQERGGVFRRERSYGRFRRQIALPEGVDPESIKASFENGVLEVTMPLPKESAERGRSIPIQPKAPPSGKDVH
jgi:HSP20 family protein